MIFAQKFFEIPKYQAQTQTKKTLFTTLITPYGTKENDYYHRVAHSQLTLDALFD